MSDELTRILMGNLEIRDTSSHDGPIANQVGFPIKTIIIENGLDEIVTLQCQASANEDFSNSFSVGSPFDVGIAMNTYQSCTTYFPYFRVNAICNSAPSSGGVTVIALGSRN